MPKARQLDLFSALEAPKLKDHAKRLDHGGDTRPGKRKLARPIDPKRPMHVVMRSSRARGDWSLLSPRHEAKIREIVYKTASLNDVRIYGYANSGNHLHLLVRGRTRKSFQDFARTIGALIARAVTGAKKGNAKGKFWDALMYSRVVEWGKAYFHAQSYVMKNTLEGWNLIPHIREATIRKRGAGLARARAQAPPVGLRVRKSQGPPGARKSHGPGARK